MKGFPLIPLRWRLAPLAALLMVWRNRIVPFAEGPDHYRRCVALQAVSAGVPARRDGRLDVWFAHVPSSDMAGLMGRSARAVRHEAIASLVRLRLSCWMLRGGRCIFGQVKCCKMEPTWSLSFGSRRQSEKSD